MLEHHWCNVQRLKDNRVLLKAHLAHTYGRGVVTLCGQAGLREYDNGPIQARCHVCEKRDKWLSQTDYDAWRASWSERLAAIVYWAETPKENRIQWLPD